MTARPPADRDLAREVAAIKRLHKRATAHAKRLLADLIEIGERLQRVKDRVGHGNWLSWLRKNFDWSPESAGRYMSLHDLSQTAEFRRLRNLPLDMLYLLARTTADVRKAMAARAEAGEIVTRHMIFTERVERETRSVPFVRVPEPRRPPRTLTLTLEPEPEPEPEQPEPAPAASNKYPTRVAIEHTPSPAARIVGDTDLRLMTISAAKGELHSLLAKYATFLTDVGDVLAHLRTAMDGMQAEIERLDRQKSNGIAERRR
jgi:hypothetical protein